MPGLVHSFSHEGHDMHQPAIHVIQPPGNSRILDPRSFSTSSKPPVSYAGYIFTKTPTEYTGQKETWAIIDREQIPASQADLKSQIEKSRKRGVTGLDQYMDSEMKGFKRKQIDELIRDCVRLDPDHRFEYIIASIKRDTRRRQSGPETSTMQVILKRQLRPGIDMQGPPFMGFGSIRLPSGGFVDLSGAAGSAGAEDNASMICHPDTMHLCERSRDKPWVQVDHLETRSPIEHAHSLHGHPSFAEEDPDVKYGDEDPSTGNSFEDSVGVGTSNVHDGSRDVRSPLGDVSVEHDAAPSPMRLNAPHFFIGRAPSPEVIESHSDHSPTHEINFGQPSLRLDGSHHDHPIFGEEVPNLKHGQSELLGAQHHEEINDLKSLSSDKDTQSINLKLILRISKPLRRVVRHVRGEPEYHYNRTNDLISLSTQSRQSSLVSAARYYPQSS